MFSFLAAIGKEMIPMIAIAVAIWADQVTLGVFIMGTYVCQRS